MVIEDILPWHLQVVEAIRQRKHTQHLAQSLVLGVSEAQGSVPLSYHSAQAILCDAESTAACQTCKSCLLMAYEHPDLMWIKPESHHIKVDQIRALTQQVEKPTQVSTHRVVVIEQADRMNKAAANALLKTLEEPESQTIFFLMTAKKHLLPATILSRSQVEPMHTPTLTELENWLSSHELSFASEYIQWAVTLIGGVLPLRDLLKAGQGDDLLKGQKMWIESLRSGFLHPQLAEHTREAPQQSLAILYSLLKKKLQAFSSRREQASQAQQLVQVLEQVAQIKHELSLMPTVNYVGLCQRLITQYKTAIAQ